MREVTAEPTDPEQPPIPPPQVEEDDSEGTDDDLDDKPEAKPEGKLGKKGKKLTPVARESKAMNELRTQEDRNLKEWLEEIAPGGAIRVKVTRQNPKVWKGLNVGGSLATYDQQIDEDFIRDHHGGGDFYLIVQRPKTGGPGWQYAGGRVIRIAGDPRTDDVFRDKSDQQPAGAAGPSSSVVDRALGSLERQLERAQSQPAVPHGPDTTTIQLLLAPLQAQIDQMGAMLREKDRQLAQQMHQAAQPKPVERDEFRDRMLATMMEGDSARITMLREQHASELRQLKEAAIQNENRLYDRFERDKQQLTMSHERELSAVRSAYDLKVASQEASHATMKQLLEAEIRRLQADLTEQKAEVVALRAKKDKGPLEMIRETHELKEMLGLDDGKDEKSGWEKAAELVGNLPAVQGAISKLAGDGQPAPQPQPQMQVPMPPRLATGPDGHLYRQMPNGQMVLVRRRAPKQAAQPGTAAPAPEIAPATIKVAVDFLENAFRNDQDPEQVATSVRSMIPSDVLGAIRDKGVDGFLTDVAKLETSSPLASQAGRNWARKLGKALLAA